MIALLLWTAGCALVFLAICRRGMPDRWPPGALALWGLAAMCAALAVWTSSAAAQGSGELPRAQNQQECSQIGDMVWLARVMHKRGLEPARIRLVLLDVYAAIFIPETRAQAYVDAALRFAAGPIGADQEPGVVGMYVYMKCRAEKGYLDKVFGTSL